MSTIELRNKVHGLINSIQDVNRLKAVFSVLSFSKSEKDWWDNTPKRIQKAILKSKQQAKEGKTKTHAEVMEKYIKWL